MSLYRLSHSSLNVLHQCERLFQLERLLKQGEREHYPATVLGTAFGAAVASYLVFPDQDLSLFELWKNYFPRKEDDYRKQTVAANLLIASFPELDRILMDWDVVSFQDKPAVELSFRINIDEKFYYVGYVDVILVNKWTGRYAILEVKTTSLKLFDLSPIYQNSGQGLGYSIVLDHILDYKLDNSDVLYLVGQLGSGNGFSPIIKQYPFPKTIHDRLDWFITLGMDVKKIHEMIDLNIFPRRGDSCLQYNRPCKHFGTCQLHTFDNIQEVVEDEKEYQFVFSLEGLIENHLLRIEQGA